MRQLIASSRLIGLAALVRFSALLWLAGCASVPVLQSRLPLPQLTPAQMPAFSVNQRLTVVRRPLTEHSEAATHSLDALLEVDADSMRLAAFALGQRVLSLSWDGKELTQQRHPLLPNEVDAQHVLRDVQWAYAPAAALRQQLPADWELIDEPNQRTVRQQGVVQLLIQYSGEPHWLSKTSLDNRLEGYQLIIESEPAL